MNVSQVAVAYGLTINAGNYSSERVEFTATASVAEGEEPSAVAHDLAEVARYWCRELLRQSTSPAVRANALVTGADVPDDSPF